MRRTVLLVFAVLMLGACQDKVSGPPPGFRAVGLATVAEGVSGTAAIVDESGATSTISVTLRGLTSGSTYSGRVAAGSCTNLGTTSATLAGVTAQSTSALTSAVAVQDSILTAGHAVVFSRAGTDVTCGNL